MEIILLFIHLYLLQNLHDLHYFVEHKSRMLKNTFPFTYSMGCYGVQMCAIQ